ncbi:hypothetical protein [Desulfosporosinus sp. OT]|uniref:hypothetical protein n=1 Tax=Desulfosporosinus sp. OT TaxID=913865 RepID=UPI000223A900|nr:hypothetical protein [Desulfosporosinus sp. OT]EGW39058.1 hypothetical protein DOT_3009 [Desulfosporosinus sp. OT]
MKKWIFLISVTLALSIFGSVACAKNTTIPVSKVISEDQRKSAETKKASGEILTEQTNTSEGSTTPAVGELQANETDEGISIITKSDNVNSNAPNQETINETDGGITIIMKSDNGRARLSSFEGSPFCFDH